MLYKRIIYINFTLYYKIMSLEIKNNYIIYLNKLLTLIK